MSDYLNTLVKIQEDDSNIRVTWVCVPADINRDAVRVTIDKVDYYRADEIERELARYHAAHNVALRTLAGLASKWSAANRTMREAIEIFSKASVCE